MMRLLLAALAAAALVTAGTASAATKLNGTVGPGFTITLKDSSGHRVSSLRAGSYMFVISDKSSIHDFHLMGPGVDKKTSVGGTGTTTWSLTLKKGTYKYQCDPHATSMNGSFTVK